MPGPESTTTIVVPCYNEAARLETERFRAYAARAPAVRFLFVDDGSTDGTPGVIRALADTWPASFSVLHLEQNRGKAEAVRRGILAALEEDPAYVGFWDADLATPLDAIAELAGVLDREPDIVFVFGSRVQLLGRRIERRPVRHYLGRVLATAASLLLRLRVYDTQCGAKLFRGTPELRAIFQHPFHTRWMFDLEILARLIRRRRGTELPPPEAVVFEYPLWEWRDVAGSKIRLRDFLRVPLDLLRIHRRYFRRGAPADGAADGEPAPAPARAAR